MKLSHEIVEWGVIKPYFDKVYSFNTIDIETIDNELFILGYTYKDKYYYTENNFYDTFHDFLIKNVRDNSDILTWTRYDNTHIVKMILFHHIKDDETLEKTLLKIGKVDGILEYKYKNYTFTLENVIRDSILFSISDNFNPKKKNIVIYNLKNLFTDDLEKVAKNYHLDYYSKLGEKYHIIDKHDYYNDNEYRKNVLLSNELDNRVIKDIAKIFLDNFKSLTGVNPKSIFTAGSIARSYLLAKRDDLEVGSLNFKNLFNHNRHFDGLLDYSMRSYHGGKIESYVLGFVNKAKIIDITSAYPFALSQLPKINDHVTYLKGHNEETLKQINDNYYCFIRCNVEINDDKFIHPLIVPSPINNTNLSPYGYMKEIVITKIEYDYLIKHGINVEIIDCYIVDSDNNVKPYKDMIEFLFDYRIINKDTNPSLSDLIKTILNSLYGITFELTDTYELDDNDDIIWKGYRAGDFFNPILASYITAIVRTYLSEVSYNIIQNNGKVYLNMTDSIIYDGNVTLDVFSEKKILGKFEPPKEIDNVMILGAGRYEYRDIVKNKFTIKSRGFSADVKLDSYYNKMNLNEKVQIKRKNFISYFKATTNLYDFSKLGHLIEDTYDINPFNIGGKRIIVNKNVNLNKEYTDTKPVYLDRFIWDNITKEKTPRL